MGNKTGASRRNICGSIIRKHRKSKKLTLEEVAARLEYELDEAKALVVSAGHLAKMERGEKPVTDIQLLALSIVLDVEIQDLFPRKDQNGTKKTR